MVKINVNMSIDPIILGHFQQKYKGEVSKRVQSFMKSALENDDSFSNQDDFQLEKKLQEIEEKKALLENHKLAIHRKMEILKQKDKEKVKKEKQNSDLYRELVSEFHSLDPKEKMDWKLKAEKAGYTNHAEFYAKNFIDLMGKNEK